VQVATVAEFPSFDTGQFEGAEFTMSKGDAELVVHVAGEDDVVVAFERLRWHEFTALYNCAPWQIQGAYFALAEVVESASLARFLTEDKASSKAYTTLHHFRVFLDEHGCHEAFAERASIKRRSRPSIGQSPNTSLERTRER
jgi:hypothetical protein